MKERNPGMKRKIKIGRKKERMNEGWYRRKAKESRRQGV